MKDHFEADIEFAAFGVYRSSAPKSAEEIVKQVRALRALWNRTRELDKAEHRYELAQSRVK